ncbi:MAG: cytochrome c [Burkholderiales bacterium]
MRNSLIGITLATACLAALPARSADRDDTALQHLVRHDCGSCHGMQLTGGLGPALTPQTLAQRPVEWVRAVILHGVPGTAMPAWRGLVSEDEAARIATLLKERIHESH